MGASGTVPAVAVLDAHVQAAHHATSAAVAEVALVLPCPGI